MNAVTRIEIDSLTELEWEVVEIAKRDGPRSMNPEGRWSRFLSDFFGWPVARALANERLETRCGPVAAAPESAPPPVVASPPPGPPPVLVPARSSAPLPPPHDGSTQRWLGWSLVAGGVVAGVGAAFFLDAAIDSRNALQASVNAQVAGGPRYDPGLRDDQHGHERTARALGVSSAALLVGGAVVVLLAPKDSGAGRRAALQLEPGLYAATYGQSF